MADYRNLPFKFGYGGLDLLSPPESVPPGKWTRFYNVRYRRDGTLEARPGTENFSSFYTQPSLPTTGYAYPTSWNLGTVTNIYYIGKIFNNGTEIDGYLTFHEAGTLGTGNATGYKVFINGCPVTLNGCDDNIIGLGTPLSPTGFSVVRTVAKTGVPITIIDGKYYVINRECDIADPPLTDLAYDYGTGLDDVPVFRAYRVGIVAPTTAPTIAASAGAGNLTGDYYYAYSYYSSTTGFESPLSPTSAVFTVTAKYAVVTGVTYSSDPQVDKIRLYRKGGTLSSWRLADEAKGNPACGDDPLPYTLDEGQTDAEIALAEKADTDTVTPFSTIDKDSAALTDQQFTYNWGPFLGKYHFWVGDSVRKGYVYWNKVGDISRSHPLTSLTSVSDPGEVLQNGFIFSSVPFVFSKLNLYALDYGGTDALPEFTSRLIPIGMGLAGKWAFAVGSNAVYFLSKDGIYATDCQPGKPISLTEDSLKPIFQGRGVGTGAAGTIDAIKWASVDTFRMAATAKELHFFYVGVTNSYNYHLVYDFERGAWSQWTTNHYVNAHFDQGSASNRVLFGLTGGLHTYSIDDSRPTSGDETMSVVARTGSIDNEIPLTYKEYGNLQVDVDLAGLTATITPYYDSEVTTGTAITLSPNVGDGRRDYPLSLSDYYARSIALQFAWTESPGSHPIFYQGNILFRDEEERLTHWEQPPSALGNGGWFHLKDGYFCLRSTSPVTLSIIIDNTITDTYTLASTAGVKAKIYQEFKPRRGKVFQFKLDSTVTDVPGEVTLRPFRFYGEETVLNGKPWITGATYQTLTPFGPVGYAQYRRTEGGT